MNRLIAVALIASLLVAGIGYVADADQEQVSGLDADGNGIINSTDLLIVALNFGTETGPNPCISYQIFDENTQPTYIIVNSFEEVITPRGGYWLYPGEHSQRDAIKAGTPVPPRVCQ